MKLLIISSLIFFQGGHRIVVEAVTSEEAFGEHGKLTYHTKGKFSIEPFDIKDRDAYVLLVTSANDRLIFHNYEKFSFRDVTRTEYNWSYSFSIDKPTEDFSIYAILVDRFNDDHFEKYEKEVTGMSSVEQFVGQLRKLDRVDPMNYNLFWVQVN